MKSHKFLEKKKCTLISEFYNVSEMGNFEGRNVLHIPLRLEEFAHKHGMRY